MPPRQAEIALLCPEQLFSSLWLLFPHIRISTWGSGPVCIPPHHVPRQHLSHQHVTGTTVQSVPKSSRNRIWVVYHTDSGCSESRSNNKAAWRDDSHPCHWRLKLNKDKHLHRKDTVPDTCCLGVMKHVKCWTHPGISNI